MEKKYFNLMCGPLIKGEADESMESFMYDMNYLCDTIEVRTSNYITEERFNLLCQINLIDTLTLKKMLNQ